MIYHKINYNDLSVSIQLSSFYTQAGTSEHHVMIQMENTMLPVLQQFSNIEKAIQKIQKEELNDSTLIWKRFFSSDTINQAPFIKPTNNEAVSIVQQPPLKGSKVAVWLYFIDNTVTKNEGNGIISFKRNNFNHLIHTQLHERKGDVKQQTDVIFKQYTNDIANRGYSLKNNCIRTWIYVQDVDVQYAGMVVARKNYFEQEDLRPETHYIASTGIEGRYIYPEVLVLMDAYSIENIQESQIKYLKAPTHLNPTIEYGVTFERGTSINYGDRKHIFISGTASINNKGEIVHPMDIKKQTERTIENIQVLLAEAEAEMNNIAQMIVYLRDTADYQIVSKYLFEHYPNIPQVIVLAPVCRPGWLIEIECIAIKETTNNQFEKF